MPLSPKEKETLRHEAKKREIGQNFSTELANDANSEGAAEWIVGIIEAVIIAIIGLLLLPEPVISKITAALLTIVSGTFAVIAILYILNRSWDKFSEAVRKRDREEDAEDARYRDNLANLPG
jgi:uncharacterized membrane protein